MWSVLGHSGSLAYEPWPEADESLLVQTTYNLPVQVRECGGKPAGGRCPPSCCAASLRRQGGYFVLALHPC